jgi:choline dehydrogenase-like flavoprotein
MLVDARSLGPDQTLSADICIVGAGPAGLALALELGAHSGLQILLVESGGLEPNPDVNALNSGSTTGDPYIDLASMRSRGVGGTSNIWFTSLPGSTGAKLVPLDPIDFEKRPWVPHSGWPFDFAHLAPWYEKAMKFAGAGPFDYSPNAWSEPNAQPWPLENTDIDSGVYQLRPDVIITRDARAAVTASQNIKCLLNATVVEAGHNGQSINSLKARTLAGISITLSARAYVLASGAIENARLLLFWGIGNQHDHLGRYYMDHPSQIAAEILPADGSVFNRSAFYDRRMVRGADIYGKLVLRPQTIRREKLLNLSAMIFPRPAPYRCRPMEAVRILRNAVRKRTLPPNAPLLAMRTIVGFPWIIDYARRRRRGENYMARGWSQWPDNSKSYRVFTPHFHLEQAPDPDNRLTLGSEKDALGIPRPSVHWRWRDIDRDSIERAVKIFDGALQRAGIGRMVPAADPGFAAANHHPAGTTRMAALPQDGVVDADAKVHGITNLFLAGPSVFPTCGYANPTLTILAMSLRLADHLANQALTSGG